MTLCVNNSRSGSKILDENPAASGWNTRPTELHPNSEGMAIWAELIEDALRLAYNAK